MVEILLHKVNYCRLDENHINYHCGRGKIKGSYKSELLFLKTFVHLLHFIHLILLQRYRFNVKRVKIIIWGNHSSTYVKTHSYHIENAKV